MSRSNWRVIIAAFGWLTLAAAQPNPTAQNEKSGSGPSISESLAQIARTNNEQAKRAESAPESKPCEAGNDQRESDLCAQWKAADAADRAALFGGLSIIGIVIAILLTLQSNSIARDTAKRQLRAYVSIHGYHASMISRGTFEFTVKNAGTTPAYKVTVTYKFHLEDKVGNFCGGLERSEYLGACFPGCFATITDEGLTEPFAPENLEKGGNLELIACLDARVDYIDAFGEARFTTARVRQSRANAHGMLVERTETQREGNDAT
jgi:hypothetical protein